MEEGGEEEEDEVARPPRRRRQRPGRFALCCQMRGIYQILLLHEILTKFFELVRALIGPDSSGSPNPFCIGIAGCFQETSC